MLWLRDREVDIRCVRLKPYRLEEGRVLLDVQPIIPLPETAEFQTQIGEKQAVERRGRSERQGIRFRFWSALLERAKARTTLHATRSPSDAGWIAAAIGRAGFGLNYATTRHESRVEFWIADDKPAFHALQAQREAVEAEFGAPLEWRELPESKASTICYRIEGGYGSPVEEWPRIHAALIDAMIRLDRALRRRVHEIRP